jgi:hypothetical protein
MDFGTPGTCDFPVDFDNVPVGMVLPIKCWIHTHVFGAAYFDEDDWRTIRWWESLMMEAIVIADDEHIVWQKGSTHTNFYRREPVDESWRIISLKDFKINFQHADESPGGNILNEIARQDFDEKN